MSAWGHSGIVVQEVCEAKDNKSVQWVVQKRGLANDIQNYPRHMTLLRVSFIIR